MTTGNAEALGLADTSLFIAHEAGRSLRGTPPERILVSIITIAELRVGVLAATDLAVRSQRMETLRFAQSLVPQPIDEAVAVAWAELRIRLRDSEMSMPLNDSWIAATAIAAGVPVVTQDDDYDGVPGLDVIRV